MLEDAGLFRRDMGQSGAKLGRVVEADAGDGGHVWTNHVCAVQPAAKTGFDDRDVDLMIGKILKRDCGQHVEIGRRGLDPGDRGLHQPNQAGETSLRDHFAINDNSFPNINQMGAGVEADLVSIRLKHCGDHRASASLAFSSSNMDRTEMFLWSAELLQEGPHPLEVEILGVIADNPQALEITQRGEET